jgi:hypothetical protein
MAEEISIVTKQATWTVAQKGQIAEEMQRILADPRFGTSHRSVKLLEHLVQRALDGNCESLKERAIGLEVFGRDADYDTSADPVVRNAASEIRKRLALYYQDQSHIRSVRIELPAGGYHPIFHFGDDASFFHGSETTLLAAIEPKVSREAAESRKTPAFSRALWTFIGIAIGAIAVVIVLQAPRPSLFKTTDYLVWEPFLESHRNVIVCVSDRYMTGGAFGSPTSSDARNGAAQLPQLPLVLLEDARTAHKVSDHLTQLGRNSSLESASALSFKDFRGASVLLIGGLDNPWSTRLLSDLRYSVRMDKATGERWIQDSQNPGDRRWIVTGNAGQPDIAYALLTRFASAETGGWVMAMSGTGPLGVEAGADLITAPGAINSLPLSLRKAKNFQIVLKASVVNRVIGSPQIVAVYTW